MYSGPVSPQSALARELYELSPRELESLGIPPWGPLLAEALVRLAEATRDAANYPSWLDSISKELERLFDGFDWAPLADFANEYLSPDTDKDKENFQDAVVEFARQWHSKLRNGNYVIFAHRLLGGGRFDSLTRALREDGAVVAWATRACIKAGLPIAQAWADLSGFEEVPGLDFKLPEDLRSLNPLELVSKADSFVEATVTRFIPKEIIDSKVVGTDSESVELESFATEGRSLVTRHAHKRLQEASEVYLRKARGARTTLNSSEDGISQAAHSLVELIDRVLREYIEKEDAVQWLRDNTANPDSFLFDREGKSLPTKRGEAICFVYGALPGEVAQEPSSIPSPLHSAIAKAIVAARTALQRIKHADKGSDDERAQLESLIAGIESALYISYLLARWTSIAGGEDSEAAVAPEREAGAPTTEGQRD